MPTPTAPAAPSPQTGSLAVMLRVALALAIASMIVVTVLLGALLFPFAAPHSAEFYRGDAPGRIISISLVVWGLTWVAALALLIVATVRWSSLRRSGLTHPAKASRGWSIGLIVTSPLLLGFILILYLIVYVFVLTANGESGFGE